MTGILVTGSSRGIGAAIREQLEARCVRVIGHSTRGLEEGEIAADFTEPSAPSMLWEEALRQADGEIDVLINNAGLFEGIALDTSDIEWLDAWEETLRINLTAAAQLSRFAVRHWQERGVSGRIVHIASRAGHRGERHGPGRRRGCRSAGLPQRRRRRQLRPCLTCTFRGGPRRSPAARSREARRQIWSFV